MLMIAYTNVDAMAKFIDDKVAALALTNRKNREGYKAMSQPGANVTHKFNPRTYSNFIS